MSCKKKKTETAPDVGYGYAPETIGKYIVYDVDSTVYDDFAHDTIYYKYRIKEKLAEAITDNQGRPAIKMIRYVKKYDPAKSYDQIGWTVKDVWNYTKTNTALEVVEENERITKLVFPVKTDVVWNGNAQNTLGEMDFKYLFTDQIHVVNSTTFDRVLCVEQKDDKHKNVIHRQYYIEKYAKEVGLVYREITDLYSNTVVANVPVEQRIEKGIIYKLTYVSHGIE
ncbi:MAG: hypothetical protein V4506_03955 [Bacteroidota bacterium]